MADDKALCSFWLSLSKSFLRSNANKSMPRKVALIRNEGLMDAPLNILLYYWRVALRIAHKRRKNLFQAAFPSFCGLNSTLNRSYLTPNQRKTIRNHILCKTISGPVGFILHCDINITIIKHILQIVLLLSCFGDFYYSH